jgi:hypothetical protein
MAGKDIIILALQLMAEPFHVSQVTSADYLLADKIPSLITRRVSASLPAWL